MFCVILFRFSKPKSDTCNSCDVFLVQIEASDNDVEREILKKKHHAHLEKADLSYKLRQQHQDESLLLGVTDRADLPIKASSVEGSE